MSAISKPLRDDQERGHLFERFGQTIAVEQTPFEQDSVGVQRVFAGCFEKNAADQKRSQDREQAGKERGRTEPRGRNRSIIGVRCRVWDGAGGHQATEPVRGRLVIGEARPRSDRGR